MGEFFQLSDIQFVFNMFRSAFDGVEWFVVGYIFCIIIFYIIGHKLLDLVFVYPLAFMAVTIFNPFVIVPIGELIGLTTRMRRLFWLLPVNIVLAYVFTWIITTPPRKSYFTNPPQTTHTQALSNKYRRAVAAVCMIFFIIMFGSMARPYENMPKNIYKTSNTIIQISELIEADSAATGLGKKTLYSSEKLTELRQYDPSILSMLRRSDMEEWDPGKLTKKKIRKLIRSQHQPHILALVSKFGVQIDIEAFKNSMEKCNIDYIIQEADMEMGGYYNEAGYELLEQIGSFEIYHRMQ